MQELTLQNPVETSSSKMAKIMRIEIIILGVMILVGGILQLIMFKSLSLKEYKVSNIAEDIISSPDK